MRGPATTAQHKRFCEIDGWEETKSARGRVSDHFRYRKMLPDGRILRTKVSHGKMQYGAQLWAQIWRVQLGLDSPDEFWRCLKSRRAVVRGVTEALTPEESRRIPAGVVISLTKVAGLDEAAVLRMTVEEAESRWQQFLREMSQPPDTA